MKTCCGAEVDDSLRSEIQVVNAFVDILSITVDMKL
jgi:hypothetical protein